MKKKWIWWGIYIIAVILLAVIIYAVPSLMGLLDTTYTIESGTVQVKDSVDDAWIIRDDTVYSAKEDASMDALVKDGTLVKGKSRVAALKAGGSQTLGPKYMKLSHKLGKSMKATDGTVPSGGYVSYSADGYEGTLNSSVLDKVTEKTLKSVGNDSLDLSGSSCAAGQPIFRITKNGTWWLVFFADADQAKKYTVGGKVQTTLEDKTLETTVRSVQKDGDRRRIVLSCKEYHPFYRTERKVSLENVTESDTGLLVETRSIVKIKDREGVLVLDKVGRKHFTPIQIKASNGETAAVYEDLYMNSKGEFVETVNNYDEVVKSPSAKDIKEAKKNLN